MAARFGRWQKSDFNALAQGGGNPLQHVQ